MSIETKQEHRDRMREQRRRDREGLPSLNGKPYGVCGRRAEPSEPGWVVYAGASNAESVAHFFRQDDALAYAEWRNGWPKEK